MRVILFGTREDAQAFRLCGVATRRVSDARQLESGVRAALHHDPQVGLVLLSKSVAELSPQFVEHMLQRTEAPSVMVLPAGVTEGG